MKPAILNIKLTMAHTHDVDKILYSSPLSLSSFSYVAVNYFNGKLIGFYFILHFYANEHTQDSIVM